CAAATRVHSEAAGRGHAAGGEGLVRVFPRSVHEREDAPHERRDRVLAAAERFLDRAHRPDVHGRSRLADCMRERREPADRARIHAAERARGAAVARGIARTSDPSNARRELRALVARRYRWNWTRRRVYTQPAGTRANVASAAVDFTEPC